MTKTPYAAVIKVGGSLDGPLLTGLCEALAELASHYPLLVLPGGGPFADTVRDAVRRYPLDDSTAHWMAILGMEQYGYALASLIPNAVAVTSLQESAAVAYRGATPVLLPFTLLRQVDPLPHSWDVTSDSIAAWLCTLVATARLVLLKNVPGLYPADPRYSDAGPVLPRVVVGDPPTIGGIDRYFGHLLPSLAAEVWVLGGHQATHLASLLAGSQNVVGTRLFSA